MNCYRTHHCGELTKTHEGIEVKLSGWVDRKRDHGGLLFVDLRDMYGATQCVIEQDAELFQEIEKLSLESVVSISGTIASRSEETVNSELKTGEIEVRIAQIEVLSVASPLPMPVNQDSPYAEEIRLKYRYLDLRRSHMQKHIQLRNRVIAELRAQMQKQGFQEFQTPILTASSPEGARDFLVPSRLHPGKFYALPQAPQQFKQLLMVAGFDRYFQIAPCFRDEDARSDRSPGEFYQLDFEMAFATQDDVFQTIEPVLHHIFTTMSDKKVTPLPFAQIPYHEALLRYGTDKPDLRNPLKICDVTEIFANSDFKIFAQNIERGCVVRAIGVPQSAQQPRSFFDKMNSWAQSQGQAGLGYILFKNGEGQGPIAKNLDAGRLQKLQKSAGLTDGDSVFFVCGAEKAAADFAGTARTHLAETLDIIPDDQFAFCWIVDFPLYEQDEQTGKIIFSHNPFSMPQGEMQALESENPLDIKAWQYDIVCNGIELSSGAVRNYRRDMMLKAFAVAGYTQAEVEAEFGGMLEAFSYGAPPHAGAAPGIERMVMLLCDQPNIREVIPFPMTQTAQDLMMGAPCKISDSALEELSIRIFAPTASSK